MKHTLHAFLLLTAGLASACGEPLAEGAYLGESLITISGTVNGDAVVATAPHIGLIWGRPEGDTDRWTHAETLPVTSTFPAQFDFSVYGAPLQEALWVVPEASGADGLYGAVAMIIAFDDRNGDGAFAIDAAGNLQSPDMIIGVARKTKLLYVEEPPSYIPWDLPEQLASGYHLLHYPCSDRDECSEEIHGEQFEVDVTTMAPTNELPDCYTWNSCSDGGGSGV